ncbi:maleylpyruvate isomerase family mycothiol-dependent enzyme [Nonomuraea lactucae]|uniref:maleylpyruvate isomerase family mycothiol-dependent enzyme n=1 Tax=Nonomuraea lactucae TaxID=2249762 RepID=UPI000DE2B719|nr:maleylpyruvate isomerase family mycothiol-dependent enzyme [Nonomuraea lactucae]
MTDYCAHVEREAARLVELVTGAAPAAPVPTCPGWTLADLITHVGTTHRWVIHIVGNRVQERIWSREVPNGLAEGQSGDPAWLADGARRLLATLRSADPDTPVWSWGAGRSAAYWARRMAYELLIHRVDAELALGLEPVVAPATAIDGVDEFLANLPYARWVTRRLAELDAEGATIHLHATDADGEWTITQGPKGRIDWEHGHAKGDVAVRGPAKDLLLMVYGRRFAGTLAVFGDRALLDRWLEKAAF